jgi:hypothetical protein
MVVRGNGAADGLRPLSGASLRLQTTHYVVCLTAQQQRTMSIADALYGITMRADGVTAVMSQKLERRGDGAFA